MKAIKIDVEKKEVYEVELVNHNDHYLQSIYEHLGCECFTQAARLSRHDSCLVDDNGLFVPYDKIKGVFLIDGQPQPLEGNGLIVGNDDQGESQDVTVTVDSVRDIVQFLPKEVIEPWLLT